MLNVSGPQIKQFRAQVGSGWTQARLARSLQREGMSIDLTGVAKIEGGYRKVSDVEIVVIAKVLGVTPNDILADPSVKPDLGKVWRAAR